jgi:WD40 repeat protein
VYVCLGRSCVFLDHTFSLKYIIKGHTDINPPVRAHDESESSEDLWCCEFEPRTEGRGSDVVAICGSYTILLLDTQQGRYIKKYTHSENQEIFYCMAWTTLQGDQLLNTNVSEEDESCNVLAVAGRLGSIKLLNPLQGECFRYLFGHRKAVLALTFAKAEPRWLFSKCLIASYLLVILMKY